MLLLVFLFLRTPDGIQGATGIAVNVWDPHGIAVQGNQLGNVPAGIENYWLGINPIPV